jgi:putative transcriptional regulator
VLQVDWKIPEELRRERARLGSGQLYARQMYMSSIGYILDAVYFTCNRQSMSEKGRTVIETRIDELLDEHGRSFYWLAKETGISHTTLWRLKKGRALGINFDTLEKICQRLNCQPGDVLRLAIEKKPSKARGTKVKRAK